MTSALILNIVFAAFVLTVIPGMLTWAIRTSRNDQPVRTRALRRPVTQPSRPSPRFSGAYGRRETA
jgi:hypothetical protein